MLQGIVTENQDDTPRPARLHLPGIPQHITQRGNNRQSCFYADDDYRLYLRLLQAACRAHACELHAYVLMTNHVHLLLTPGKPDSVSLVIRDTGRDYVRTINKAYRRTGTLWEGRYKSSLVDKARYCLACYRYIELNPVRIKRCQSTFIVYIRGKCALTPLTSFNSGQENHLNKCIRPLYFGPFNSPLYYHGIE